MTQINKGTKLDYRDEVILLVVAFVTPLLVLIGA